MPDPLADGVVLAFAADPPAVRAALARLLAAPPLARLDAEDRARVELVLAEVLNNIAEHAYQGHTGPVEVALHRHATALACLITDQGGPMPDGQAPPGHLTDPAALPLADLPEGGFGWALIRSLTTGLTYRRVGDENRLQFQIPLR